MDPIWDYLVDGTLPSDPKEASKLKARSARFTVHRGTLYKRGFSVPILKCVRKEDANYILREVHKGICGNHIGARTLDLSRENIETGVLLAHNAQRRDRAG